MLILFLAQAREPILPYLFGAANLISSAASALVKAETNGDGCVGEVLARWLVSS